MQSWSDIQPQPGKQSVMRVKKANRQNASKRPYTTVAICGKFDKFNQASQAHQWQCKTRSNRPAPPLASKLPCQYTTCSRQNNQTAMTEHGNDSLCSHSNHLLVYVIGAELVLCSKLQCCLPLPLTDQAGQLVMRAQLGDAHHHPPPHNCRCSALLRLASQRPANQVLHGFRTRGSGQLMMCASNCCMTQSIE